MKNITNVINRRNVIIGASGITAQPFLSALSPAFAATPTPQQTQGPFYPWQTPIENDNDLLHINGAAIDAKGQALELSGVIRSLSGERLSGAQVEIWQCDAFGAYHYVSDMPRTDEGFQGYGKTYTDSNGQYAFRTIKPAPYPGRTPHIHFKISTRDGQTLITQMYSSDEDARNRRDGIYRRLSARERDAVTIPYLESDDAYNGMAILKGAFDIIMSK